MILIIDDDLSFSTSLKLFLEDNAFTVLYAMNSTRAFQIIQKQLPDLIILDILLPEINGYQFLKLIRENSKLYYIPIIVVTAKYLTQDRIKAYSLGCNAFLSKPFSMEELISIINNLIRQSKKSIYKFNAHSISRVNEKLFEKNIYSSTQEDTSYQNNLIIELTPKEQKTLNLVIKGYMNKELAKNLEIGIRNVERYISRLFKNLGTNSRTELVKIAVENNYIT
uniref:hypothetical protein n=1 Tax=Rhodaphanes brevistipitata TaxID=446136 RepID=UPI001FCE0236|nr:hypothetical protein MW432_pgp039 [Rhodaphanes brevistipitata]UNJ18542.1 hypothetical protein [Rhodaphanes brevistipitata]